MDRSIFISAGRGLFYLGLLTVIVPKGGVSAFSFYPACILLSLSAMIGRLQVGRPALKEPQSQTLILAGAFIIFLAFQSLSLEGNPFANDVWSMAGSLLGDARQAISVQPATTMNAMLTAICPLIVYVAALDLFRFDRGAFRLLRFLALLAVCFTLFGLIQIAWLRESLLLFEKVHYRDSLTSVFVNRNTAGTMLGVMSLVLLIWVLRGLDRIDHRSPFRRLIHDPSLTNSEKLAFFVPACFFLLTLLAVFLTRSRGALLATLIAYLLVMPLLASAYMTANRQSFEQGRINKFGRRTAVTLGIASTVLLIAFIFGSQAFTRLQQQGADMARLCVYAQTWHAFLENWLFGFGFGTFEIAFPRYRTLECGLPYGTFVRAHNFYLEGLFGLGIIFVPFLVSAYAHITANLRHGLKTRRRMRFVPVVALGMVLLVTMHDLVDFSLQIPGMAAYFAAALAAMTTISLGRPAGRTIERRSGYDDKERQSQPA